MSDSENVERLERGDEDAERGRRSSRRRESASVQKRKSAFEQLKEARQAGKGYRPEMKIENVYDEVTEDEFNKIVAARQQSDFVVDDDGAGYVDHGVDFEDEYGDYDDEYEGKGKGKKDKKRDKKDKETKKGGIDKFFTPFANSKPKTVDDKSAKLDEDEELKKMLSELDEKALDFDYDNIQQPAPPSANRNPFKRAPAGDDEVIIPRPLKAAKLHKSVISNTSRPFNQEPIEDFPVSDYGSEVKQETYSQMDDDTGAYEDNWDRASSPTPLPKIDAKPSKPISELRSPKKEEIELKFDVPDDDFDDNPKVVSKTLLAEPMDWETEEEKKEPSVETVAGSEAFFVTKPDGQKAIRMYWMDAFEDHHKNNGTVFLFGKLCTSGVNYASCCLVARNIQRQVFFRARKTKMLNGQISEQEVTEAELIDEIKRVLKRHANVSEYKIKKTVRRLTLDGAPAETPLNEDISLMEVHYSAASPALPLDLEGSTFSAVLNLTTTPLERLLTEIEIKGPGWIDVTNYVEVHSKQSYCDFEFTVDMERMKNISYQNDLTTFPPTARMLAINIVTTLNEKKENEICMISTLYNPKCNLSNPSTEQKSLQRLTLISKPPGGNLPFDLKTHLAKSGWQQLVLTAGGEKALLSLFLAKLRKYEPDVLIGHDLSQTIHLLASRMEKLKVVEWSRTSRLKRIVNLNKIGHTKSAQWELTAGRMQLDSKVSAMELVRLRSYDLSELAGQLLNVHRQSVYANEVLGKFSSSRDLLSLINWSWTEGWLALRVIAQLNALPLYVQITNIVGGVMSRTLLGGRAERNEFLLLHAFHKANLIAPNKSQPSFKKGNDKKSKKKPPAQTLQLKEETISQEDELLEREGEGEEGGNTKTTGANANNKAQYSGGLVLDPKVGLYETMILLLDFNSLYPSIIQEYNICFTTVPYSKESDEIPSVPDGGLPEGVLPKEIRQLVERRREVKKLMKGELNDMKRKQYDIRQMALKLTANSMYGCLGFQQSRFYAKPLAALVTSKGREILLHSKTLVEKMGYGVVYGDTDSIMINTQSVDLQQVKKLGNEIKAAVNKCHRLLELELDGVFKRMLLLKKKKYAALSVDLEDERKTSRELKGLDIVRRDWSQLAKETGISVVNLLLSTEMERFDIYESIENTLKETKEKILGGQFPLDVYQISKQLTRDPRTYADVKSQPHAAVALRLNASGKFNLRHGDIVEYIICEDGTSNSAIQRAYHRTEMESNENLKIDVTYYLSHQIHPVVSRLCAPIEEMDAVRIAEALGLDGTNYRRAAAAGTRREEGNEDDFDMQMFRFKADYSGCEELALDCPNPSCIARISLRHAFILATETEPVRLSLEECPHCFTLLANYSNHIINQFTNLLSSYVERQLTAEFKCDDESCSFHTRVHPLKWFAEGLECPKCLSGVLRKEYTTQQLYDQQAFFKEILDLEVAINSLKPEERRSIQSKVTYTAVESLYNSLLREVSRFLERNDFSVVDLQMLFSIFGKPLRFPRHLATYYHF